MIKPATVVIFAISALLTVISLWPHVPNFDKLTKESATVVRFTAIGPAATNAVFQTASGINVSCSQSRTGRCPIDRLSRLKKLQREMVVWHDGKHVFQIAEGSEVIFPYKKDTDALAFGLVLAILVALFGLIQLGFDTGLINRYDDQGNPL